MEGTRLPQQRAIKFVCLQAHIGPRITVENELGRVLIRHSDEGHSGTGLLVVSHPTDLHALLFQDIGQVMTECLITYLADKGALCPQSCRGHGHIGRCAARFRAEG